MSNDDSNQCQMCEWVGPFHRWECHWVISDSFIRVPLVGDQVGVMGRMGVIIQSVGVW